MLAHKQYASLECLEVPGQPGAPVLIFFHGFGANAADLYGLHQYVNAPAGATWIFPEGRLKLADVPGHPPRAWWPIDQAALEYALATGTVRDLSGFAPPGLHESRDAAADCIRAVLETHQIKMQQLHLGGFSQGAMLATELTLRSAELFGERPASLAILSGTLLDEEHWRPLAADGSLQGLQFFQSHGQQDPILDFAMARRLEQLLRAGGLSGEFVEFTGGHEIPPQVMARLGQYLTR